MCVCMILAVHVLLVCVDVCVFDTGRACSACVC